MDNLSFKVLKKNWVNDGLHTSLMRDLLPFVRVDELANSFVLPLQAISACFHDISEGRGHKWFEQGHEHLPSEVWAIIREKYPEAACFPLGYVAERSVKRLLKKLDPTTKKVSEGRLLYEFTCFFMFEAAMMNLRGSSEDFEQDYGYLYHFSPDGGLRTLEAEAELRQEIWRQSKWAARQLLESLKRLGPSAVKPLKSNAIIRAFYDVFKVPLKRPPEWYLEQDSRPIMVLGLRMDRISHNNRHIAHDAKIIAMHGEATNVLIDLEQLVKQCNNKLHSLLRDLVEIAAAVYIADIYLPRNEWFSRDLTFLIPVRHPKIWKENAEALARPIRFLSGNIAEFDFVKLNEKRSAKRNFKVNREDNRVVSLFSGGIDSFVGATDLIKEGKEPWLVSHYASPMLRGIQKDLAEAFENEHIVHVSVPVRATGKGVPGLYKLGSAPPQELVQYTRSFLFLSLASCLAIENGIGEIRIYESGVVAHNPALSESRFNTKTAHPIFIQYYRKLINDVFGIELNITNPFVKKAKGEVLKELGEKWHNYLNKTNSCWAYPRVKIWAKRLDITDFGSKETKGLHCGRCIPCIWRRAAIDFAGLSSNDDSYLLDYLPKKDKNWVKRVHLTLMLDLMRFCQNASTMSDENLLDHCPDLYDGAGSLEERIKMLRKFSNEEMLPWFDKHQITSF